MRSSRLSMSVLVVIGSPELFELIMDYCGPDWYRDPNNDETSAVNREMEQYTSVCHSWDKAWRGYSCLWCGAERFIRDA